MRSRPGLELLSCLAVVLLAPAASAAVKIGEGETFATIGALLQTRADVAQEQAPDLESPALDLYVRRVRLILAGQLDERIGFFIETDSPNLGRRGDLSAPLFVQDAFVELAVDPRLRLLAGMLLVPFSRHGMQGATTLLAVDYHTALLRYPTGSTKVLRDFGMMARGLVLGDRLEYRLALLNGVQGSAAPVGRVEEPAGLEWQEPTDPRNPADWPRVTGRLTLNLLDADGGPGAGGYFYDGIDLKESKAGLAAGRRMLSVGASVDWQRDLNVTFADVVPGELRSVAARDDYLALAADVFWDLPVARGGLVSVTGQVNVYLFDHGDAGRDRFLPGGAAQYSGYGVASEAGVRYDRYQLYATVDWFEADAGSTGGDAGDLVSIAGGLAWWWRAHATALKLEVGEGRVGTASGPGDWTLTAALQLQLWI